MLYDQTHGLGLPFSPQTLKLITKREDPYQWSILTTDKLALFKKQLSKHSTGSYIDLCNGVGQHFEAVLAEGAMNYEQTRRPIRRPITTSAISNAPQRSPNYSRKDIENLQLAAEEWHERADAEMTRREALEVELTRAKSENAKLLNEIKALREAEATQMQDLEKKRGILFGLSHMLQDRALKAYEDAQQVTRVAEYLQPGSNPRMSSHSKRNP
jgi:hypothetical protein